MDYTNEAPHYYFGLQPLQSKAKIECQFVNIGNLNITRFRVAGKSHHATYINEGYFSVGIREERKTSFAI